MRWTIVGILILGAVLLVADDSDKGTTRKPGELVLPQKFEAKDYPGDEGNQILLVWGASTGDNTQFEEIEERYKELVKKEASNWKEQIRELVDAVPGARSVFSGLEADLFGRVTSKVRMRLAADVEKEKKVVYELYYSDKRGVPAGERNLLGRVGSNEMTNLVTAKPDLFGKRPKERFAHFFVVDVERVFCSREAERIDELKSMLLGQTRIKDELKGADRERKEIEEERLKLRAMLKLLDEACRGEKAEPYNVAYWLEELIKQMAIVERLGESRQKALDFSIVGEEKLKDASVGERVARAQRNLENALLSLGDVFKNSWLGCYVVKEIEEKMDEMERLLRLQKEEAENLVMMLEENLRRAEEKEKVLKGLSDKSLAPRFIEELRASVAEMYREVQELRMSLEIELGKKSVYAEAAGEAAKRYNSFVVSRSGMLGRIYEAWKRLCEGTPEKAEVLKTGIERIKRTVEESEAEYEKRYEEVVGFALLYRFCADGGNFMREKVKEKEGETEKEVWKSKILVPEEEIGRIGAVEAHPSDETSGYAESLKEVMKSLLSVKEEGVSYGVFEVFTKNLTTRYLLVENQVKALMALSVKVQKAGEVAKAVGENYRSFLAQWERELREAEEKLKEKKGREFYFYLAMRNVEGERLSAPVWYQGDVFCRAEANWFDVNRLKNLVLSVILCALVLYFIGHARRNPHMFIRKISGLDAVDEAVGRATEMGKPVFYLTGLHGMSELPTIASVNILSRVARKIAQHDTRLRVPCYDPIVMSVAQEVYKEAATAVGRPDAYRKDDIFYVTSDQFSYAAAVDGMMVREKPATIFLMGYFYAESLILAETGSTTGAIQIAGTDAYVQVPFFVTTCDYTLIGEELYAASAYLSREPMLLGSLRGQDIGKALFIIALIVGTLFALVGSDLLQLLFTEY